MVNGSFGGGVPGGGLGQTPPAPLEPLPARRPHRESGPGEPLQRFSTVAVAAVVAVVGGGGATTSNVVVDAAAVVAAVAISNAG